MAVMAAPLSDLSHAIQLAVAPVFLLTGIATLINAMNTRLGRIVDRRRAICKRLQDQPEGCDRAAATRELALLMRRGNLIYLAIFSEALSALLVCLVVAGAFAGTMVQVELAISIAVTFLAAMASMISGLGLFLREVFLAVRAGTHWEP
jgi:hypothetical protein